MTTANHAEDESQSERTNSTLAQHLCLYIQQNPAARLDFLPFAGRIYSTALDSSVRCSPAALVYTEVPLDNLTVKLIV